MISLSACNPSVREGAPPPLSLLRDPCTCSVGYLACPACLRWEQTAEAHRTTQPRQPQAPPRPQHMGLCSVCEALFAVRLRQLVHLRRGREVFCGPTCAAEGKRRCMRRVYALQMAR